MCSFAGRSGPARILMTFCTSRNGVRGRPGEQEWHGSLASATALKLFACVAVSGPRVLCPSSSERMLALSLFPRASNIGTGQRHRGRRPASRRVRWFVSGEAGDVNQLVEHLASSWRPWRPGPPSSERTLVGRFVVGPLGVLELRGCKRTRLFLESGPRTRRWQCRSRSPPIRGGLAARSCSCGAQRRPAARVPLLAAYRSLPGADSALGRCRVDLRDPHRRFLTERSRVPRHSAPRRCAFVRRLATGADPLVGVQGRSRSDTLVARSQWSLAGIGGLSAISSRSQRPRTDSSGPSSIRSPPSWT